MFGSPWTHVTVTANGATITEEVNDGKEARTMCDQMLVATFDLNRNSEETDVQFVQRIVHDFLSASEFDELMAALSAKTTA